MFDLYDIRLLWLARARCSAVTTPNVHHLFIVIVVRQRLEAQKRVSQNTYGVRTYVRMKNKFYLYCMERIVGLKKLNVHMAVFTYVRQRQ